MHPSRFPLIDIVRLASAAMVALYHLARNFPGSLPLTGPICAATFNKWVWGQSYVIIFFVVSGFCIHWPQVVGRKWHLMEFYSRRLLRVIIPLAVCACAGAALGLWYWSISGDDSPPLFWSIIAEVIYYLIYPILLRIIQRIGINPVLAISWVLAGALVWARPGSESTLQVFGNLLTWIVGLPCWLTGVWLAEAVRTPHPPSQQSVWLWRVCMAIVVIYPFRADIMFHRYFDWSPGPLLFAMMVAPVCGFWLRAELPLAFWQRPWHNWLASPGKAAYSIYLLHMPALQLATWTGVTGPATFGVSAILIALISLVFYLLIERPSCRLAAGVALKLARVYEYTSVHRERSDSLLIKQSPLSVKT